MCPFRSFFTVPQFICITENNFYITVGCYMIEASKLAGFLAAHSLMSIKGGDRHVVNYGYVDAQGKEHAQRIKKGLLTKNMKIGQNTLIKNPQKAIYSALIYNCMGDLMPLPVSIFSGNDILVVEFKSYEDDTQAIFGLRYDVTHSHLKITSFWIYFLSKGIKKKAVLKAFWKGFSEHEFGGEIYAHMDIDALKVCEAKKHGFDVSFFFSIGYGSGGVLNQPAPPSSISNKFDDASWHYGEGLPEGYEENALGVHIGVFAIWCALNGLAGDTLKRKVSGIKKMYESRSNSPGQWCIDKMDGQLTNDALSDDGNAFAYDYYDLAKGEYRRDYFEAAGDDDNDYAFSVPDSWETYDKVAPIIARRYEEWRSKTKE